MIHAFSLRNYAVGTVYSKTETVWVALFATYISHEPLHLLAWMGILVCLGGVAILSVRGSFANVRNVLADLTHKGALYGMLRARSSPSPPAPSARPPSSFPRATSWCAASRCWPA